jgi:hypothetical protein
MASPKLSTGGLGGQALLPQLPVQPHFSAGRQRAIMQPTAWCAKEATEGLLFEKRSKNFCSLAFALGQRDAQTSKSFLVLFFKKERLTSYQPRARNAD